MQIELKGFNMEPNVTRGSNTEPKGYIKKPSGAHTAAPHQGWTRDLLSREVRTGSALLASELSQGPWQLLALSSCFVRFGLPACPLGANLNHLGSLRQLPPTPRWGKF